MKLLLLSKENIQLAKSEAEALLGKGSLVDNVFLVDTKQKTDRLAYTKFICGVLFEANDINIEGKIKKFSWNKHVKGSFALTFIEKGEKSTTLSRKYGGMVYDLLKNPKVDLENPKTSFVFVKIKNKIYACLLEYENKEDFNARKSQNRPENMPISLNPKLAGACVNLTGSLSSVYDPFCGAGGFLIEAGLMKLKIIGSDVSEKMVKATNNNLKFFKIKNFKVFKQDALEINKKYDYIVSDFPYGKSTKIVGNDLYSRFILNLRKILRKRAVLMMSCAFNADSALKKSRLKVKAHFSFYIHKSLTKEIYVLEP